MLLQGAAGCSGSARSAAFRLASKASAPQLHSKLPQQHSETCSRCDRQLQPVVPQTVVKNCAQASSPAALSSLTASGRQSDADNGAPCTWAAGASHPPPPPLSRLLPPLPLQQPADHPTHHVGRGATAARCGTSCCPRAAAAGRCGAAGAHRVGGAHAAAVQPRWHVPTGRLDRPGVSGLGLQCC